MSPPVFSVLYLPIFPFLILIFFSMSLFLFLFSSLSSSFTSGEIVNHQKAMEYNSQTGVLQCNFNYMQLRRIKRNSDRKSTEIVMEEKFTILFRSKFTIPGDELDIPVMVCMPWLICDGKWVYCCGLWF